MRQFREKEPKSAVPISTPGSIKSQFRDSLRRHEQCSGNAYRLPALASKVLVAVGEPIYGHKNCQPHFLHVPSYKLGGIHNRYRTDRIRDRREYL